MFVSGCPLVSVTVATRGCVTFWLTVRGTPGTVTRPAAFKEIVFGGQVEKKPAELDDCVMAALMVVAPG